MSELRQSPTTKEWVIIAPERAKRPQKKPVRRMVAINPDWEASCPFCVGNEAKTPPEILRRPLTSENTSWSVRVVPNLYSALHLEGKLLLPENSNFYRKRPGVGVHEVIIDSPSHSSDLALLPYDHVENVLIAFQTRYNELKKDPRLKDITIFKNHGWTAGMSLAHPHSQLVATPVVATYYNRKFKIAHDYYVDAASCLYCELLAAELKNKERIVTQTDNFVVFHPYASHVPYETWIMPKQHSPSYGLIPPRQLAELATVLKDSLLLLYRHLDDPDYNLMIDSTTTEDEDNPYYDWHIRIMPRLGTIAGFEMGSGILINTALPEETAGFMRKLVRTNSTEDEWRSFM